MNPAAAFARTIDPLFAATSEISRVLQLTILAR